MNLEQARVDFDILQKRLAAFNHATAIIFYDGETSAPPDTLANRSQALQVLNEEVFKIKTGQETLDLLEFLDENKDWLTIKERRCVDFMLRDFRRKSQIPPEEYSKYETLITESQDAWHIAREENNFDILKPYLDRLFKLSKQFSEYCTPGHDPYEYWLDLYEEGLDVDTCEKVFSSIKAELVPLFKEVMTKPPIDDSCLKGDFSAESQENLAVYIMELIGINMNRVGLATAEHPFTTYLGSHFDERIATKYSRKDYSSSLYTVLHQSGHILYDTGQADNLAYTVLDGGQSMGLLESQGSFYENIVGRSREFIEYIFPEMEELFPEALDGRTSEDLYRAVNKVTPRLIRMDAGELTVNIHVMIRYELERAIMSGDLSMDDLRDAWNQKYKEYLGLDVTDDVNGILQDIHWPFGGIGYYPSYVLGNVYAAQLARKMDAEIDLKSSISEANFKLINLWNKEHIWKHGGLYNAKEIMERHVGIAFDTEPYITYVKDKYSEIYNL